MWRLPSSFLETPGAIIVPLDIKADALVALCKKAFRPAAETTVEIDAERFHATMRKYSACCWENCAPAEQEHATPRDNAIPIKSPPG
jgi:hypothetical protein